jgi:copper chaperone CopZ
MSKNKLLFLVLAIVSSVLILSACGTKGTVDTTAQETVQSNGIVNATFKVDGMYCASCPFVVESTVKRVEGVKEAKVEAEGPTGTVSVQFDKSKTDLESIQQSVLDLGYEVQ